MEDCKECQQYGGHKYTVTDTSLSLEYESVDGQHKTFVLTRWIPEKNTLSASEALKTYEIIGVNRGLESWIQKRDALILSELACATGVHRLNPPVSKSGVKLWKPIEEFSNEKNKPLPEGYGLLCEKCMRTYNTKIDTTTHMNINCVWFSYSKLARYFVLTSASSVPKLRKWENGQEYKGYTVYTIKPDGEQWNGYYSSFYTQNKADGNKLLRLFDREDIGGLRAGDLILIVNGGHTYLIDSYQDGVFYYSDNGAASRAVMQGLVRYHQNPEKGFHPLPEDIEVYQKTPSELVKEYKQIKSRIVQITVFRPKTD